MICRNIQSNLNTHAPLNKRELDVVNGWQTRCRCRQRAKIAQSIASDTPACANNHSGLTQSRNRNSQKSPAAAEIRFSSRSRHLSRHLPDKWRVKQREIAILPSLSNARRPHYTSKCSSLGNHLVGPFRSLKRPHDGRLAFEKLLIHRKKSGSAASTISQGKHDTQRRPYIQSKNVVHALVHLG